jgi:hypothetical protein|tara:strand:+ start:1474 stop:1692 length:219 start_codon:yes stop_codon:yes gene_type:complete
MKQLKLIEEHTKLVFNKYEQLSYNDKEETYVELFIDDELVGEIEVWGDSEMDGREYICVNYEILYLDELKTK